MSKKPSRLDSAPPDICLLLRAYAEQRWLSREVIPVLRQLEDRDNALPAEQEAAAHAYLDVVWIEALRHARETEAAHVLLEQAPADVARAQLYARANRYHTAVRRLRQAVARQVDVRLFRSAHVPTGGLAHVRARTGAHAPRSQ